MFTVNTFLELSSKAFPHKKALVFGDKSYTYQQVYQMSRNLAGFLINQGIKRGDRVSVYSGNTPESAISIYGILEAGGCFVVINPTIKEKKLQHILKNSDTKLVIAEFSQKQTLDNAIANLENPPLTIFIKSQMENEHKFEDIVSQEVTISLPSLIDLDLAAIIYTSGSTGKPKGVTMTHRNIVSAATSITTYLENSADDIILNMLPLSFDYGLYQLLMAFKIGGTLVLERGFGYPYQVIQLIKKEKITGLPFVPTIFAIILQMDNLEKENLQSVRYITNTAAALPPNFIPRLKKIFPKAHIYSMYGLTECKRVSYLPPDMIMKKPNSVGIPMPNTEVWVVDENDNRLPPGQVGELVVRGGSVMKGYWKDPEETAKVLRKGFYPEEKVLYTGDLFRIDEEGYLYFVGREDDIIKSRGERVSPKEIENVLYSMGEVLNVRVTGIPDNILGQAIKAEIVVKEGRTLNEKNKIYSSINSLNLASRSS